MTIGAIIFRDNTGPTQGADGYSQYQDASAVTSHTTGQLTTAGVNDVILAFGTNNAQNTPQTIGGAWTASGKDDGTTVPSILLEWQVNVAAATFTMDVETSSLADNLFGGMVAFKAASLSATASCTCSTPPDALTTASTLQAYTEA